MCCGNAGIPINRLWCKHSHHPFFSFLEFFSFFFCGKALEAQQKDNLKNVDLNSNKCKLKSKEPE